MLVDREQSIKRPSELHGVMNDYSQTAASTMQSHTRLASLLCHHASPTHRQPASAVVIRNDSAMMHIFAAAAARHYLLIQTACGFSAAAVVYTV